MEQKKKFKNCHRVRQVVVLVEQKLGRVSYGTYSSLRIASSLLMSRAILEFAYMIIELRKVNVVSSKMRGSTTSFMY